MVEHELQLRAIVGHIVGFATDEVGTTLTNAEDLVGNQLGLLCLASGLKEIAGHHVGGLELQGSGLLGLRWCRNRRSRWFGLLVDGPEATVVGEIEGGKGDFVAEIDVIGAGAVGLGGTTELYLGDFPVDLVFLSHVLEAEILLGIHGELSGHDLGAVGRDLDLDFGGGQAIGEAVVEVVTDGDLLDCLGEGACGEEGGEEGEGYFHWELGMMGSHGWLRRRHGGADGTNAGGHAEQPKTAADGDREGQPKMAADGDTGEADGTNARTRGAEGDAGQTGRTQGLKKTGGAGGRRGCG